MYDRTPISLDQPSTCPPRSFTAPPVNPAMQESMMEGAVKIGSIGVILYTRSFYVNKIFRTLKGPVNPDAKKGATVPWAAFPDIPAARFDCV